MSKPVTAIVLSLVLSGLPAASSASDQTEVAVVTHSPYIPGVLPAPAEESRDASRKPLLAPQNERMQESLNRKIELQVQRSLGKDSAR